MGRAAIHAVTAPAARRRLLSAAAVTALRSVQSTAGDVCAVDKQQAGELTLNG